jgi:hypothetical protein
MNRTPRQRRGDDVPIGADGSGATLNVLACQEYYAAVTR